MLPGSYRWNGQAYHIFWHVPEVTANLYKFISCNKPKTSHKSIKKKQSILKWQHQGRPRKYRSTVQFAYSDWGRTRKVKKAMSNSLDKCSDYKSSALPRMKLAQSRKGRSLSPRPRGIISLSPKLNQYNLEAITDLMAIHMHDSSVSKRSRRTERCILYRCWLSPNSLHQTKEYWLTQTKYICYSIVQRSASEVSMFSAS